ncbi:MAG: hypothetical protein E2O29_01950 [Deltaproteobacteria bacterium]|nr:MAG: hypothetical protein E2O29_01950 [Deltaproteobacteria bacterium]
MANSYRYKVFKTEYTDDLTTEQMRVLTAMLAEQNKEAVRTVEKQMENIPSNSRKGRTTYRIANG